MTISAMLPGHGRETIDKTRSPDRVEPCCCHKPQHRRYISSRIAPLGDFKPHPMATRDVLGILLKGAGELPLHTSGGGAYLAAAPDPGRWDLPLWGASWDST